MKRIQMKYGFELELKVPKAGFDALKLSLINLGDIVHDGSIIYTVNQQALEIRSRVGNKREIMELAQKIGERCLASKATVNESCGYHLHVSHPSFFVKKNINRLVFMWCAIEDVLISTQPKSRYNNRFCRRKMIDLLGSFDYDLPTVKRELIDWMGGVDRYCAFNLNALRRHGTIEIRLHAGTVNPEKIQMWIELMTNIFNYAICEYKHSEVLKIFNMKISDEKIQTVFDLLKVKSSTRAHFTARIEKFGFTKLAEEQDLAIEFIKALPSYKKKRNIYNKFRKAMEAEGIKLRQLRDRMQGGLRRPDPEGYDDLIEWQASSPIVPPIQSYTYHNLIDSTRRTSPEGLVSAIEERADEGGNR